MKQDNLLWISEIMGVFIYKLNNEKTIETQLDRKWIHFDVYEDETHRPFDI